MDNKLYNLLLQCGKSELCKSIIEANVKVIYSKTKSCLLKMKEQIVIILNEEKNLIDELIKLLEIINTRNIDKNVE